MKIDVRSMAGSDAYFASMKQPAWTSWEIDKAVQEGYQANPWVFRAIQVITQSAGSVPWVVFDAEMSPQWEHPISKLLASPNPQYPRQRFIELLAAWLELSGNAYVKKVLVNGRTLELWPVSPDRIAPVPSTDPMEFILGYKVREDGGREWMNPEYNSATVIHMRLTDPANPYKGVSPLGAAAKSVDLDNSQLEWNTATMQNRGVVDGVFTFKRTLESSTATSIMERIIDKFSGKRNAHKPLVIGDDATYTRLALSPTEMDFLESRKNNREEILSVFGVPPQLVGVQESSTYNNFSTSLRIFWESTMLPLLDLIKDSLNHSLANELQPGLTIGYDTSEVAALQENEAEKVKIGKTLYDMGVPVSVINEKLALGLPEYEGWDKSKSSAPPQPPPDPNDDDPALDPATRSFELVPLEQRSADSDAKLRDELAEGKVFNLFNALLKKQGAAVLSSIEAGGDPLSVAASFDDEWEAALTKVYVDVGVLMAKRVVQPRSASWEDIETRENVKYNADLESAIKMMLISEKAVLIDLAHISETLAALIIKQSEYAVLNGLPPSYVAQALTDTGAFSPERALRIARTTTGAATSIGQLRAGVESGATHKVWLTSKNEVRDAHAARDGEVRKLNEKFSTQIGTVGPMYPLDPNIAAGDRINCRCFMTFKFEAKAAPKPKPKAKPKAQAPQPTNAEVQAKIAAALKKIDMEKVNAELAAAKAAADAAAKAQAKAAADAAAKINAQLAAAKAATQALAAKAESEAVTRLKQSILNVKIGK